MKCPKCDSEDIVIRTSTTKTKRVTVGFWWHKVENEEKSMTVNKCLDCGEEWEG
jgi:ribosomal protein S27E